MLVYAAMCYTCMLLMKDVLSCGIFEGEEDDVVFVYSLPFYQDLKYFLAGQLVAWCLFNNGPGLDDINGYVYDMIVRIDRRDIPSLAKYLRESKDKIS